MLITKKILANAIRFLSIDSIELAKSGHPGAVLGMADIAEVLWRDFMNHNPCDPRWINRDRFILSNGHASMLLYSILHLTGYNLTINDIKNFRKFSSKTPGHPELGITPGVESTTGPLGQGIANAVGLAIAEKTLSYQFNKPNYNIIDHYIYSFAGDGCMMEGISHEACSLAGTLKLGKLIVFYDSNKISIDGNVKDWFDEDVEKRFIAYNWHVINNIDGHNYKDIRIAIKKAKNIKDKPSLLICNTIIGYGSPNKSGKKESHGFPLGKEEINKIRRTLNWQYPPFKIPNEIYKQWDCKKFGKKKQEIWNESFFLYKKEFPDLANELYRRLDKKLPENWNFFIKTFIESLLNGRESMSTRMASNKILESFNKVLPEMFGGSADLSYSNLTLCSSSIPINKINSGNYLHYGAREFGMSAISNGISLYGGFIPYVATFLVFMEYACNAIRMAALMKTHVIFVYTHDSIGVGEDGPTHQPIEQLSMLRTIPNMITWRPCDVVESVIAWKSAIENNKGPTSLVFSRQDLKFQERNNIQLKDIYKGGYILRGGDKIPDIILLATGSEVELAIRSYEILKKDGYNARVVSMPSTNIFDLQDFSYKEYILPSKVINRIAIEASASNFWYKYVGLNGIVIGIDYFGKSASKDVLFDFFGFTLNNIIKNAKFLLKK